MNYKILLLSTLILMFSNSLYADVSEKIKLAMTADHRAPENISRNEYRHPVETLTFFGLRRDMTVVEIWPGGGWYTEILASVTRGQGILYAAGFSMTADKTPNWRKDYQKKFTEKLENNPEVYDHVVVTELAIPERTTIAPPGTADMVLTFRNVHNWLKGDYAEQMFKAMARALKTGGVLGVVEHRAKVGISISQMKESGYMTEAHVIELAERAGFVLEEKSEVNANPKDLANYPAGVWTLPPTLRLCKKIESVKKRNECTNKYTDIGESDRMTLKFRKLK